MSYLVLTLGDFVLGDIIIGDFVLWDFVQKCFCPRGLCPKGFCHGGFGPKPQQFNHSKLQLVLCGLSFAHHSILLYFHICDQYLVLALKHCCLPLKRLNHEHSNTHLHIHNNEDFKTLSSAVSDEPQVPRKA